MEPSLPPPYGEEPVRFTTQEGKRFEFEVVNEGWFTKKPDESRAYAINFTILEDGKNKRKYVRIELEDYWPGVRWWDKEEGKIERQTLLILFEAIKEALFYENILTSTDQETVLLQPNKENKLKLKFHDDGSISWNKSEHYDRDLHGRVSYEICKDNKLTGISSFKDKIWFPEETIWEVLESGGNPEFPYWILTGDPSRYRITESGEWFLEKYLRKTEGKTIGFKPPAE